MKKNIMSVLIAGLFLSVSSVSFANIRVTYETKIASSDSLVQDFKVSGFKDIPQAGDKLTFSVEGEQDAKVKVKFVASGKVQRDIKLVETEPGTYTGSYVVKASDKLSDKTFTAYMTKNNEIFTAQFIPHVESVREQVVEKKINPHYGKVINVATFDVETEGVKPAGTIGGAVVGGILGNQVGGGNGKKLATVLGAVAGGVAGNSIDKKLNKETHFKVTVKFEDGLTKDFVYASDPGFVSGDSVEKYQESIKKRN